MLAQQPSDTVRGPHARPAPGRVIPAPPPPRGDAPESVSVVPGPEYRASWWRRTFAGRHYRDLWLTPIRVPVLDLARFAGGLTPIEHGGGSQTISLHMQGANDVVYVLRSVDKRPFVPEELQGTIVSGVISDQTSAAHPSAALIAVPLEQAAGVLHVPQPSLYVIPDDPRLGAYRAEFAGMLAEVEERPTSKDGEERFQGASKVEKMEKILNKDATSASTRLDSRSYLTARLMDFYMGDWDRGAPQWRWARFGDKGDRVWKAIPLDRDWAFMRSDGILSAIARTARPELIVFNGNYPPLISLTFQEWEDDRRILQDIDRAGFDSTARWMRTALTDSAIRNAVAQMPPEQQAKRATFMVGALHDRRDKLPREADLFYRQMAWGADVHSAADPSVVDITRRHDTVDVRMRAKDAPAVDPYFARSFVRGETHEVRLYLDGGPDSITVRGGGDGVKVRIITGGDHDVLVDSTGDNAGPTRVYDYGHPVRVIDSHAIGVDSRHWKAPKVPPGTLVRDVGQRCTNLPGVRGGSDAGAIIGLEFTCDEFGFRRQPWALSNSVTIGYASATGGGGIDYLGQIRPVGDHEIFTWHAAAVSSQFIWYFGQGNNTPYNSDLKNGFGEQYYRGRESYFEFNPGLTLPFDRHTSLTLSPFVRYWQTAKLGTFIKDSMPYGVGPFGEVGGTVDARFDTRDDRGYPTSGVFFHVIGRGVPGLWDAQDAYGKARASASIYLTPSGGFHPTLGLRVGGEKVWGNAPFVDMAHIGATAPSEGYTVRGYIADRFTGTASVFGNAQVELPIARPRILLPVTVGLIGINDIGRVFLPGEHSSTWHDGYGGGLFLAPLENTFTASFTLVHGADGNRFYFGYGVGL